jgi:hypothetical protein
VLGRLPLQPCSELTLERAGNSRGKVPGGCHRSSKHSTALSASTLRRQFKALYSVSASTLPRQFKALYNVSAKHVQWTRITVF